MQITFIICYLATSSILKGQAMLRQGTRITGIILGLAFLKGLIWADVNVSGVVVGDNDIPLGGCLVKLSQEGSSAQTDPSGYFQLKKTAGTLNAGSGGTSFDLSGQRLRFTADAPHEKMKIVIHDLHGHRIAEMEKETPAPGEYIWDLGVQGTRAANALVVLQATLGKKSKAWVLPILSNFVASNKTDAQNFLPGLKKVAATSDTLNVFCSAYPSKSIPLTNLNQDLKTIRMTGLVGGLVVTVSHEDTIPTSYLALFSKFSSDSTGLVKFKIQNKNGFDVLIDLSAKITGYTNEAKKTISAKANRDTSISLSPQLLTGIFQTVTEQATASYDISASVTDNGAKKYLLQETPSLILLAKDVIKWGEYDSVGNYTDMSFLITGWVKPHIGPIDTLIHLATNWAPNKTFVGYQETGGTHQQISSDQVMAIYKSIQRDYGLTYVNSPTAFPDGWQKVRFPEDALKLSSANCIDGAVLFASAIESIGMNPRIIVTPTHAFVAWDTWPGTDTVDVLETTMVKDYTFDQANAYGRTEYQQEIDQGHFKNGTAVSISIKDYRALGITPLPKMAASKIHQ